MYNPNDLHVSGESIKLRLTEDMKKWLFQTAKEKDITVSHLMRSLIYKEMHK